jgi:hypothetical protein
VGEVHEDLDSSYPLETADKRGTQLDLKGIIASGLASIREELEVPDEPSRESQAVDNLKEIVDSYRDLVRTDSDVTAARSNGGRAGTLAGRVGEFW